MNVLALSGSLRKKSVNTALLRAAAKAAPEGVNIEIYDISDVPLYNDDLDTPQSVTALRTAIANADAVLLANPEYNYSVSGVLKNAIDWASRPAFESFFLNKKVGIMSASPAATGGVRGQQHLKVILLAMAAEVAPLQELAVAQAYGKFTDGELTDESAKTFLTQWLKKFCEWAG